MIRIEHINGLVQDVGYRYSSVLVMDGVTEILH